MARERHSRARQATEQGVARDSVRGSKPGSVVGPVDEDRLSGGVDKLEISRRKLLVVLGGTAASAAVATCAIGI